MVSHATKPRTKLCSKCASSHLILHTKPTNRFQGRGLGYRCVNSSYSVRHALHHPIRPLKPRCRTSTLEQNLPTLRSSLHSSYHPPQSSVPECLHQRRSPPPPSCHRYPTQDCPLDRRYPTRRHLSPPRHRDRNLYSGYSQQPRSLGSRLLSFQTRTLD